MRFLMLARTPVPHPAMHWFGMVSGVIVGVFLLIVAVELILMIPDFIKTVKIHLM